MDARFDESALSSPRGNRRTVESIAARARVESLDLVANRGNPSDEKIHNKMVLAQIGGQGWVLGRQPHRR